MSKSAEDVETVPLKKALAPWQVQKVLAVSKELQEMILAAAFFTGARISELLSLRWSDFDFERQTVTIRRSISAAKGPVVREFFHNCELLPLFFSKMIKPL